MNVVGNSGLVCVLSVIFLPGGGARERKLNAARRLFFEPLEERQLLAGDLDMGATWQYAENPLDTNSDGALAPSDALLVMNQFSTGDAAGSSTGGYVGYPDVNGDNAVNDLDLSMVVDYLNSQSAPPPSSSPTDSSPTSSPTTTTSTSSTSPTSSTGGNSGSSTGASSAGYTGPVGGSGGGSCTISGSGLQVSGPAALTVNEKDDFTVTICWQDAYWLTVNAPHITPSAALILGGVAERIMDDQGNPRPLFVPSSGQAVLQLGYPDDAPPGTSSDLLPITLTAFAYYNQVSAPHVIDVTVNNVPPTVSIAALTSEIDEGGTAKVQVVWGQAYWYEGVTDVIAPQLDWGDGSTDMSQTESCSGQYGFTTNSAGDVFFETCRVYLHTYLDDGPSPGNGTPSDDYTVSVVVADDDLGSDTDSTVVKVNNVKPKVVITEIRPINSVSEADGGRDDRVDESEGFIVEGNVTDPGVLDKIVDAKLNVDLNFDGAIDPNMEVFPLTLQGGNGSWTFVATVAVVPDDGANYDQHTGAHLWGNDTVADELSIEVRVEDDDTGDGSLPDTVLVWNVEPKFVDDPNVADDEPHVSFDFDANGKLISATVKGSFTDVGTDDFHRIGIDWGDGGEGDGTTNPIQFDPGILQFSITRQFDPQSDVSPDSLYPILIELEDDDLGMDLWSLVLECDCACGTGEFEDTQGEESPVYYAMAEGEQGADRYSMTFEFSDMKVQVVENGNAEFEWSWKPTAITHTSASGEERNVPLDTASILLDVQGSMTATDNGAQGLSKVKLSYREINHPEATDHQSLGWGPLKKCDYGTFVQTARVHVAEQAMSFNPAPLAPGTGQMGSRVDSSGKYIHDHWGWAGLIGGGWVHTNGYPLETSPYAPSANGQSPPIDPGAYSLQNYWYIGYLTTTMRYKIERNGTAWANVTWKFFQIDDPNPWPTTVHKRFSPVPVGSMVDLP